MSGRRKSTEDALLALGPGPVVIVSTSQVLAPGKNYIVVVNGLTLTLPAGVSRQIFGLGTGAGVTATTLVAEVGENLISAAGVAAPANSVVLPEGLITYWQFADTPEIGSKAWVMSALNPGPAYTGVPSEIGSAPSALGTGLLYARNDHAHGVNPAGTADAIAAPLANSRGKLGSRPYVTLTTSQALVPGNNYLATMSGQTFTLPAGVRGESFGLAVIPGVTGITLTAFAGEFVPPDAGGVAASVTYNGPAASRDYQFDDTIGTDLWVLRNKQTGKDTDDGVYTPVGTPGTNVTSITPGQATWLRVGNTIHVSGRAQLVNTGAGAWSAQLQAPVSTAMASQEDGNGCGVSYDGANMVGVQINSLGGASDQLVLSGVAINTNQDIRYTYSYRVM